MPQASQSENKLGKSKKTKEDEIKHSEYYYEFDRNKSQFINYKENATPNYYVGNVYGYKAKDIIYDYDLTYNLGTALTYILRAGKKKENGMNDNDKRREDIQKAINHLTFEYDQ